MRQASRKKKFPITYSPNRIFTLQKSLDENVILHSASGVFENSVFQFTMTEATEAFFWLSAIYLPCMSCQNAASIFFIYRLYIFIFMFFLLWRWTWAGGRWVCDCTHLSCQAHPTFYEILIWMRVQLLLNIRRCVYGVCQWGLYMSCFIPDIGSDAGTLISSHNHILSVFIR